MGSDFYISPGTRAKYTPTSGMTNISMDFNAAPSGNARGTEVVIPDNASPEVRAAAQRYNAGVASFASQYGIQDYPVRGVKTRSENGRGVSNTIHTEPFFNSDLAMQQAILENPQAFAEVYRDAFGTLPDMRLIAAHGIGADRGAASSVFKDETSFGELMAKTLLGSSQPVADDAMEALGRSPIRRDIAPFIGQQPIGTTANAPTGGILSNEGNQMAQQPQGLLGSMGIQRRDPNAQGETSQPFYNRQSFGDTMARIAPALGRMGVMGLEGPAQAALDDRNKRQGDERAKQAQAARTNQTREWIASQPNGEQFAAMFDAVGLKATSDAMNAANAPAPTSASYEGLRQQALAGGLEEGTPEFQKYILNGGGDTAAFRSLHDQAMASGFEPGSPEYKEFMATRGAGLSAAAATTGKNLAEAETGAGAKGAGAQGKIYGDAIANAKIMLPQAQASAEMINNQVQALLDNPNLDRMLGPLSGRLLDTSTEAVNIANRIEQLQGQAFLQARQFLKGSGTITDFESNRAEAAMSRMKTTQDPVEFREALVEFNAMVQQGAARVKYQSERTIESYTNPPPLTPVTTGNGVDLSGMSDEELQAIAEGL